MFRRWAWDFDDDLSLDRHDTISEILSQAMRAAAAEEPDADGNVLFGQLKGTVVGLRYYTGVVSQCGDVFHIIRTSASNYEVYKCQCLYVR